MTIAKWLTRDSAPQFRKRSALRSVLFPNLTYNHTLRSYICIGDKLFRYGDFFSEKIIVGPHEAQYPQFLLQLPLTHYILRSIFFRTHSTPPICLKTQKCAILSTFLESGGKNQPKVGVRSKNLTL